MDALLTSLRQPLMALCGRYGVSRLDAFGSVVRDDFDTHSDVDLAVEFSVRDAGSELRRFFSFREQLQALLQRSVDLVELHALPDSRLKRRIERERVTLYAAPG